MNVDALSLAQHSRYTAEASASLISLQLQPAAAAASDDD